MSHEWWVIREYGIRYWVAYILVRIAHHVKDTTYYQVIRTPDGSAAMFAGDTWGSGVLSAINIHWDDADQHTDYAHLRDFDDFDEALDWMHDIKPDQEAAA